MAYKEIPYSCHQISIFHLTGIAFSFVLTQACEPFVPETGEKKTKSNEILSYWFQKFGRWESNY